MTPIENATLAAKKDVDVVPLLKRLGLSDKEQMCIRDSGYADLTGSYWQQHLAGAGRIKQ